VHAILLTGGSAYGLDAATGVMRFLEARGVGFPVRHAVVPIVPGAVIFDLGVGDPRARPDAALGLAACRAASPDSPAEGSIGAGMGATVAKSGGMALALKGGIGTASVRVDAFTVAALVVVNAWGEVVDEAGVPLVRAGLPRPAVGPVASDSCDQGANTTIGVVATDLPLDKAGATRLALAAHDGLAMAVRPAHTAYDGDTFFAMSTATAQPRVWPVPPSITWAAADVVAQAIRRAVRLARGAGGVAGLADDSGPPSRRS